MEYHKPKHPGEKRLTLIRERFELRGSDVVVKTKYRCSPDVGGVVGSIHNTGYRVVRVQNKLLACHHIAYYLHHGVWPPQSLDHQDGDKLNNHPDNLRLASTQENQRNQKKRADNTSGVTGVSWCKTWDRWRANITISGEQKALGYFLSFDEAAATRKRAEVEHDFHGNHGR